MTRLLIIILAVLGFCVPAGAQPVRPRIAVVSIHIASSPTTAQAGARRVADELVVDFYGLESGTLPGIETVDLSTYDLVLIDAAGPAWLNHLAMIESVKRRTRVAVVGAGTPVTGNVDSALHPEIAQYWENSSEENYAGLFAYLGGRVLDTKIAVPAPIIHPRLALWHPDAPQAFPSFTEYLDWAGSRIQDAAARPRIGILFYRSLVLAKNARVVEAIIQEVEQQGGLPIPIWREGGADLASNLLGNEKLDAMILCGNRIDYGSVERGVAEARRWDVPPLSCATDTSRSPDQWRSHIGGFAPGQTGTLGVAEMEGIIEPMVVGARTATTGGRVVDVPILEQVQWRVARAMSWARLHRLPNSEKRVVITYHSEDASEADVGSDPDSYLDAQASIVVLLQRLRAEGYDTGTEPLPNRDGLAIRMAKIGSNVPSGQEAALEQRIAAGAIVIDSATYREWYGGLPELVRKAVEARWGPPPGNQMTTSDGRLVVPALRFGKVVLAAHPVWGMADPRALSITTALPPHHQYLAFYLWMQRDGRIDAYLPLFTQLSLMPGKQQGPASDDIVGVLIGTLPHIQPLPLQANGGVGNKRRTQAVTIGFVPELVRAGLGPDLRRISNLLDAASPDEEQVRRAASKASLDRTLELNPATAPWPELERALRAYLGEAAGAPMPKGGHVLGQAPDAPTTSRLVQAMLAANGGEPPALEAVEAMLTASTAPQGAAVLAQEYARRIADAPKEMDAVLAALSGRYVPPGPMGDAIRNPDTLPGGRNPYTLDIRAMPSHKAWESGSRLAEELVDQHRTRTGQPPRKVAFVLWSGEAAQNGGTTEAQILRLLGARPIWNARGQVVDVALDGREALRRGRIDVLITTSGTYRDNFGAQLELIAKAIGLAAAANEPDNAVRTETGALVAALRKQGLSPEQAETRATRRIFSTAPGAYSPSTQFAVKEGWSAERMNQLYEARLGYVYGQEGQGEADSAAFSANLAGVDAAVFARSSSTYGLLDTPLPAAYFGGLSAAVRTRTGRSIETYIANGQNPSAARIETLARFYGRERDSRYLNPEWIRSMQESGYNGARYMADLGDSMLLWDVTKSDLVTDRDWEAVRDVYLRDRYRLGLASFFERHNPAARRKLASTMLEAVRRGSWRADAAAVSELRQIAGGSSDGAPDVGRRVPVVAAAPGSIRSPGPARLAVAAAKGSSVASESNQVAGFELVSRPKDLARSLPLSHGHSPWQALLLLLFLLGSGLMIRDRW